MKPGRKLTAAEHVHQLVVYGLGQRLQRVERAEVLEEAVLNDGVQRPVVQPVVRRGIPSLLADVDMRLLAEVRHVAIGKRLLESCNIMLFLGFQAGHDNIALTHSRERTPGIALAV
jgi:hypothetical protein